MLQSVTSPEGNTLSYTYDGSLPLTETWSGEVNGTVGVKYDADFKVTAQTINGTDTVKFVYDKDGNLINAGQLKLKLNAQNGLLQYDTLGNTTTAYTYNTLGELTGYTAKYGSTTLYQTTFTRDSLGRISTKSETIGGITKQYRYRYDTAGRLWEVYRNDTLTSRYGYDQNGNRIYALRNAVIDSGRYDSQDRMTSYGGNDYVYTKSGYLKYKIHGADTTSFTYDTYGNLISVKLPDGTWAQYVVDATNRRIGKQINGVWIQKLVYSSDLAPAAELDSANDIVARFVYSTHQNVPDYIIKGGSTYKVITDQLGSVRLVVDIFTGSIIQQIDYDEFGQVIFDSNPGFQPFVFAGGLFDQQTRLVRFGARDYDAFAGRWTAKDPIGFESKALNFYGYAISNPINVTDPDGKNALFQNALIQFSVGHAIRSALIGAGIALSQGLLSGQSGWDLFETTLLGAGTGFIGGGFLHPLGQAFVGGFVGFFGNIGSQLVSGKSIMDISLLSALRSSVVGAVTSVLGPKVNPKGTLVGDILLGIYAAALDYFFTKEIE
jgi:RHS repeat-associated protein